MLVTVTHFKKCDNLFHIPQNSIFSNKDASDLANGIRWVLEHEDQQALSDACVKKVQENYTEEVVAKQYMALYKRLLHQKK